MLSRLFSFSRRRHEYDILPSSDLPIRSLRPTARWRVFRRCSLTSIFAVVVIAFGAAVCILSRYTSKPWIFRTRLLAPLFGPKPLPPLYPEFVEAEMALPQHHVPDPFVNGTKYLWVSSHPQWSGWGNWMQDLVLTSHMAYRSGRAFVFDDYSWDGQGPAYSLFDNKKWIPTRIPLSAIISGPIVGGSWADGDYTPRSISRRYWEQICPRPTKIDAVEVRKIHGGGATAVKIEETWLDVLSKIDDPCVKVIEDSGYIFHVFMFGTKEEIMPIWPYLKDTPILQMFGWSTLAHQAFDANRHLFAPAPSIELYTPVPDCPRCVERHTPLDGLLALHIRRGDFLEHCENLCRWGANFNAFNQFDGMSDPWEKPTGPLEESMVYYLRRCLPSVAQIVARVEEVRESEAGQGRMLRRVYVMTNGAREWADELKAALSEQYAWESVATSRDLVLTNEEKYVAQGMDMMIGQRAQAFIGNGFSSLSSNIAMLRMSKDLPVESTWMW